MGASLLAIAVSQLPAMLDVPAPSRAGSLPQVSCRAVIASTPAFQCGSGLARDSVTSIHAPGSISLSPSRHAAPARSPPW
ncbi:hypothetical protein FGE05_23765 [Pseudomonas sp. ICMP22404]|nr:hypothetical protein FGE05_23765 [Pseudomonas sp. ICMP22404]